MPHINWASQVVIVVKNLHVHAGNVRDIGSISGSERSPGGGHGNPLQYFCLENPMDREAWWATAYRIAKSWIQLKWLSMHTYQPAGFKSVFTKSCSKIIIYNIIYIYNIKIFPCYFSTVNRAITFFQTLISRHIYF